MVLKNGSSVAHAYQELVARGALIDDPAQRRAASRLDRLREEFEKRAAQRRSWFGRRFAVRAQTPQKAGIYLTGQVGRGKTMLMDMFFASVGTEQKRRDHFHGFMQDVHERLFALRQAAADGDAAAAAAEAIAAETRLLCLDEFQVTDITDAMLLGRLFAGLIAHNVFIVVSSNTEPDDLYEGGLNRQLFLPSIRLIKERFAIVAVSGETDYRLERMNGERLYVSPLDAAARQHMQNLWERFTQGDPGRPAELTVKGRVLRIPCAAHGTARFSFAELCEAPLGPADYLALAQRFDTIFLEDVPPLGRMRRDSTRRMITLIDALYDARVRLVVSAAAAAHRLAPGVKDFARTASRLQEMQSRAYWSGGRKT